MYNRYLPRDSYQPVSPAENGYSSPFSGTGGRSSPFSFLETLLGGAKNAGSAGISERLGLGKLDSGDILLLLILFYLFRESGDEEWLLILALVFFAGSG